jgi:hypothetical protein
MRCGFGIFLGILACATPAPSVPAPAAPTRIALPESYRRAIPPSRWGQEFAVDPGCYAPPLRYRWEIATGAGHQLGVDSGPDREVQDPDARLGTGGTTFEFAHAGGTGSPHSGSAGRGEWRRTGADDAVGARGVR